VATRTRSKRSFRVPRIGTQPRVLRGSILSSNFPAALEDKISSEREMPHAATAWSWRETRAVPQEGKKGHTEEQMVAVLRQVGRRASRRQTFGRKVGISQATFYHCCHATLEGGECKKSARWGGFPCLTLLILIGPTEQIIS